MICSSAPGVARSDARHRVEAQNRVGDDGSHTSVLPGKSISSALRNGCGRRLPADVPAPMVSSPDWLARRAVAVFVLREAGELHAELHSMAELTRAARITCSVRNLRQHHGHEIELGEA